MGRKRSFQLPLPADENGCWIWPLYVDRNGYGKTGNQPAHRWVYEKLRGPIPEGLQLDHLCRVKRCVNPDHLEPVTFIENVRRHLATLTECSRGHEFNAENTRFAPTPSGGTRRSCRVCDRENQRAYTARRRGRVA